MSCRAILDGRYDPVGYKGVFRTACGRFSCILVPNGDGFDGFDAAPSSLGGSVIKRAEKIIALLLIDCAEQEFYMHSAAGLEEYAAAAAAAAAARVDWSAIARFVQWRSGGRYVVQRIECGEKTVQCIPVECCTTTPPGAAVALGPRSRAAHDNDAAKVEERRVTIIIIL